MSHLFFEKIVRRWRDSDKNRRFEDLFQFIDLGNYYRRENDHVLILKFSISGFTLDSFVSVLYSLCLFVSLVTYYFLTCFQFMFSLVLCLFSFWRSVFMRAVNFSVFSVWITFCPRALRWVFSFSFPGSVRLILYSCSFLISWSSSWFALPWSRDLFPFCVSGLPSRSYNSITIQLQFISQRWVCQRNEITIQFLTVCCMSIQRCCHLKSSPVIASSEI